ncbi:MAG: hypothetical protein Tsb0015_08730 [Simkaniaceae bacterium]
MTRKYYRYFFLTLLIYPLFSQAENEPFCYFEPPKGWNISHPGIHSSHVKIGFVAPWKKGFAPSINLAIEHAEISLQEYVQTVKQLHLSDAACQYYSMGNFPLSFGPAHLAQIDIKNEYGDVRILQLLAKYQNYAIIVTAATLKKDFFAFKDTFFHCFHSLKAFPDFDQSINKEEKEKLEKVQENILSTLRQKNLAQMEKYSLLQEKEFIKFWKPMEKYLQANFSHLGAFWQILAMQKLQEELKLSLQKK